MVEGTWLRGLFVSRMPETLVYFSVDLDLCVLAMQFNETNCQQRGAEVPEVLLDIVEVVMEGDVVVVQRGGGAGDRLPGQGRKF